MLSDELLNWAGKFEIWNSNLNFEPIKFESMLITFSGATGEITLWILVYLAQAYSLHLLW